VFAFSGVGAKKRSHFEWKNTLDKLPVDYVLFRDDDTSWFHFCFDQVIDFGKPDLTIGMSMGGYAALLFGAYWNVPVMAFCPQTFISQKTKQKLKDSRWEGYLARVWKDSKYPDLFDLDLEGSQYRVFYCKHHKADALNAERIRGDLHPIDCGQHNVAESLNLDDLFRSDAVSAHGD
jgi:hypothetical protein